ncbi:MAG TPA: YceI family protein [Gemmatimonadaceae bacterium]|nr:YceI family protein [Gemmatimonadaceae bacterium]
MLYLHVLVASTRAGRQGPRVGAWILEQARAHGKFQLELVDLAEVDLPFLDEPAHPQLAQYEHAHTKTWSAIVNRADAFVFVTPEYDHGAPASLVNALQYLVREVDDLRAGAVNVTVRTASIHTLNEQRDAHLRTPDFFAADSFPTITFRSTKVKQYGTRVRVHGDLTMRGRTRPVVLSGVYLGRMLRDPWGKERVAFQAATTVHRQDFGIAFNQKVEGASMIDDEVRI